MSFELVSGVNGVVIATTTMATCFVHCQAEQESTDSRDETRIPLALSTFANNVVELISAKATSYSYDICERCLEFL